MLKSHSRVRTYAFSVRCMVLAYVFLFVYSTAFRPFYFGPQVCVALIILMSGVVFRLVFRYFSLYYRLYVSVIYM